MNKWTFNIPTYCTAKSMIVSDTPSSSSLKYLHTYNMHVHIQHVQWKHLRAKQSVVNQPEWSLRDGLCRCCTYCKRRLGCTTKLLSIMKRRLRCICEVQQYIVNACSSEHWMRDLLITTMHYQLYCVQCRSDSMTPTYALLFFVHKQ